MEKFTPHCRLSVIQEAVKQRKVRTTQSALVGAAQLGLDFNAMLDVISHLKKSDFYKSMTTHANHQIWQDVYRPVTAVGQLYLKLTFIEDVLIVSFKEL